MFLVLWLHLPLYLSVSYIKQGLLGPDNLAQVREAGKVTQSLIQADSLTTSSRSGWPPWQKPELSPWVFSLVFIYINIISRLPSASPCNVAGWCSGGQMALPVERRHDNREIRGFIALWPHIKEHRKSKTFFWQPPLSNSTGSVTCSTKKQDNYTSSVYSNPFLIPSPISSSAH